ncbi:MAG TPA: hypothetical protein PKD91_05355 [Bacteroidia bacterium]|nr:hypothetical protein [Bacteroidia bacterium]
MFRKPLNITYTVFILIIAIASISCKSKKEEVPKVPKRTDVPASFENYWKRGAMEVTRYELSQARYGEIIFGEAVMIFSTEFFSRSRQMKTVKKDSKKGDVIEVLKMVQFKKFMLGAATHSVMNTVYTPVNHREGPYALKLMCSTQEWEGQSYSQMNLDASKYNVQLRSYLETEGDQNRVVLLTLPEDQLWCTIRINPQDLPTGDMLLIPGLISQRFRHTDIAAIPAKMQLTKADTSEMSGFDNVMKYTIQYTNDDRLLEIYFNNASPHEIYGWKETYKDGEGTKAKKLTSTGVMKKL